MPEQNGVSSANTENQNRPEPDADANSPEDALARLEAMCLMANLGLGLSEIRGLIAAAFQLITYQSRLPDGKRRLIQITELSGLEHDRYVLQPLMRFTPDTDKLHSTGVKPGWE